LLDWRGFSGCFAGLAADDGQIGAHGDGLVLADQDLGHGAGDRGGDLRVDLVGRDLEQRLVDIDLVTLGFEPTADRALGHRLTQSRHRDGGAAGGLSAGRCFGGCFGNGRLISRLGHLFLGCRSSGGLLRGRFCSRFCSRGLLRGRFCSRFCLFCRRRGWSNRSRCGVTDDGQVGADRHGLVLGHKDLLQDSRNRRGDLGVDLVGRDLQQRLVDGHCVANVLEPAGHGAFGDRLP
jgi:hypothetical protein